MLWAVVHDIMCTYEDHGVDTMEPIFKAGKWDADQMLAGIFDPNDENGRPLEGWRARRANTFIAGGWFGGLLQLRQDLDWAFKVTMGSTGPHKNQPRHGLYLPAKFPIRQLANVIWLSPYEFANC